MKNIVLLFILFAFTYNVNGQTCYAGVPANAIHLPNDTVIISQNTSPTISDSYVPCASLRLDSSSTVQNRIYLRPGTTFIADSLSTLYGGFFIYADSGSTVDMNFKTALQLSYTAGATLIDTNSQSNMIFCSILPFDFTNMIQSHTCYPLSTADPLTLKKITIAYDENSWRVALPNSVNNINYEIFAIDGRRIRKGTLTTSDFSIDNSNLVDGMYIIRFAKKGEEHTIKLLKN